MHQKTERTLTSILRSLSDILERSWAKWYKSRQVECNMQDFGLEWTYITRPESNAHATLDPQRSFVLSAVHGLAELGWIEAG